MDGDLRGFRITIPMYPKLNQGFDGLADLRFTPTNALAQLPAGEVKPWVVNVKIRRYILYYGQDTRTAQESA